MLTYLNLHDTICVFRVYSTFPTIIRAAIDARNPQIINLFLFFSLCLLY